MKYVYIYIYAVHIKTRKELGAYSSFRQRTREDLEVCGTFEQSTRRVTGKF